MRRYLVVANQTLLGDALLERMRACVAAGPCRFHVIVPATHVRTHLVWTEGHHRAVAQTRLAQALPRFRALGMEVDGEVGDPAPLEAIGDALRRGVTFDEIILSTLPPGASRWLRQDLPHRMERAYQVPVTTLVMRRAVA